MKIIPYLYFQGNAEEAINFYHDAFGGDVPVLSRFSEGPEGMPMPEGYSDKVMHARLQKDDFIIYFSDGAQVETGMPHSLTLEFDSQEEQDRVYAKLSNGGKVHYELQDTFWGARFGKLTDRFGVNWDLNFQHPVEG